jgi:dsRNA-specific ribonuclease
MPGPTPKDAVAETVEAILGAIFIDSQDHEMVAKAIEKMQLVRAHRSLIHLATPANVMR